MIRTCKWCKKKYDTKKAESALFCVSNPNRKKNLRTKVYINWRKRNPGKKIRIGALTLKPNTWA